MSLSMFWRPVTSRHCRCLHLDCLSQPGRWGFPLLRVALPVESQGLLVQNLLEDIPVSQICWEWWQCIPPQTPILPAGNKTSPGREKGKETLEAAG